MTPRPLQRLGQAGFTLVEAVIVIVIIGLIGAVVAVFIRMPIQNYQDSVARAELTDLADLTLRRIARDLRLALPNSIVVSPDGAAISLFVTKTGGRYLAAEDDVVALPVLDFDDATRTTFTVIGQAPANKQAILAGDFIVVNNVGIDPADAYTGKNMARVASVTTAPGALPQVTLASNPFPAQDPAMPSPGSRFHVVEPPITYSCTPGANGSGSISRLSNYGIVSGKPASGFTSNLVTTRVTSCNFRYDAGLNTRNALVVLTLELEMPGEAGRVRLVHQVHVDNTP